MEALQKGAIGSGLILAGVSNTWWSDALRPDQLRQFLQTYGFAPLFVVVVTLLGIFFGRNFRSASSGQKDFAMKFAGVAVGAAVLHLFTLLRSDNSHFWGPSFLLPILLLMLPFFFAGSLAKARYRWS